jgi:hypothetical protein
VTQQRYAVPERVLVQEVQGEAVLLNLDSEQYYALDRIGTRVWELLAAGRSAAEIRQELIGTYPAQAGRIAADIDDLIASLLAAGLLQVRV